MWSNENSHTFLDQNDTSHFRGRVWQFLIDAKLDECMHVLTNIQIQIIVSTVTAKTVTDTNILQLIHGKLNCKTPSNRILHSNTKNKLLIDTHGNLRGL